MTNQTKTILVVAAAAIILYSNRMALGSMAEELIKKYEAGDINKYLTAYIDPVGIPTVGYGSTFNYDRNRKVMLGDKITQKKPQYFY